MDTLELCGDLLQPWGQLETPGLVDIQHVIVGQNWSKLAKTILNKLSRIFAYRVSPNANRNKTRGLKLPPRLQKINTQFQSIH